MSDVVYFVKHERRVKIGTTVNIKRRFATFRNQLGPVELLATVPGTHVLERHIHRLLAHLRISGEWFRDTPELRSFIEQVKQCGESIFPAHLRAPDRSLEKQRKDGILTLCQVYIKGIAFPSPQGRDRSRPELIAAVARKSNLSERKIKSILYGEQIEISAYDMMSLRACFTKNIADYCSMEGK